MSTILDDFDAILWINMGYITPDCPDSQAIFDRLNFDTTGIVIEDNSSLLKSLGKTGIEGSGTATIGYVKSHVVPSEGGIAPFTITSILEEEDNQVFQFSNLTYTSEDGIPALIIGNPGVFEGFSPNNDRVTILHPLIDGMNTRLYSDGAYAPDNHIVMDMSICVDINSYFTEIFDGSSEPLDFCIPILIDLTIAEAYVQNKLDASKWVTNIPDTPLKPAGSDDTELGGVYVPYDSGLLVDGDDGKLKIDPYWTSSILAGQGLNTNGSKLNVANASNTTVGGIKIAVRDGACYITTNGQNP